MAKGFKRGGGGFLKKCVLEGESQCEIRFGIGVTGIRDRTKAFVNGLAA